MFNYNGTLTDVSTLSHETGHACYDILCNRNQSLYNWGAATFTHEVASLTNEMIFYNYMIDNAKTDEEKIKILRNRLIFFICKLLKYIGAENIIIDDIRSDVNTYFEKKVDISYKIYYNIYVNCTLTTKNYIQTIWMKLV